MDRVLLVESGSRGLAERFLAHVYQDHPAYRVDVLTCFQGEPANFDTSRGQVISIHNAGGSRARLIGTLARSGYNVVAILCANEPIMTPWKWAVGVRVPAKLLIVNENADYFWFDTGNMRNLRALIKHRFGVHSVSSPQLVLEALAFPFVFLFLLANAGWAHARRAMRGKQADVRSR